MSNDKSRTPTEKKRDFLKALRQTMGVITTAADATFVTRDWVYKTMVKDPKFKKDIEAIEEVKCDFGESALLGRIKADDTAAIIFFNKCKNKKRGYVENDDNYKVQFYELMEMFIKYIDSNQSNLSFALTEQAIRFHELLVQSNNKEHLKFLIKENEAKPNGGLQLSEGTGEIS